jgi:hypothetical protein
VSSFLCRSFVVPLSFLCRSFVVPLSFLCRSFVVPLSFLCRSFVVPLSFLCPSFVLPLSFLCPSFVLLLPSSLFLLASYHSIMLILSKGMKVKRMSYGRDVQAQLCIYLRHQKQPQQLYDSLSADAYLYFSTRPALFFRRAHQAKPHDTHGFELITGNAGNEPRTSSRTSARTLCLSDPECSFR